MPSPLRTTIRDLHRQKGRARRGLTLAEGVRLVEEAVGVSGTIEAVAWSPVLEKNDRGKALLASLTAAGIDLERMEDAELEQLADTQHPQGIIAVVRAPRWALKDIKVKMGPVLVLDGVQDPGNTGTILRTALGLGAAGIIALPGTVEVTNPKVLRGSMGAVFRLPWVELSSNDFLEWVRKEKMTLLAAATDGDPISGMEIRLPAAVVVGNEGAGLSPAVKRAGRSVSIPISPGTESLNVAVAAGILLYEVGRGR
jgi:RNA methyltransferase, TrmH family